MQPWGASPQASAEAEADAEAAAVELLAAELLTLRPTAALPCHRRGNVSAAARGERPLTLTQSLWAK